MIINHCVFRHKHGKGKPWTWSAVSSPIVVSGLWGHIFRVGRSRLCIQHGSYRKNSDSRRPHHRADTRVTTAYLKRMHDKKVPLEPLRCNDVVVVDRPCCCPGRTPRAPNSRMTRNGAGVAVAANHQSMLHGVIMFSSMCISHRNHRARIKTFVVSSVQYEIVKATDGRGTNSEGTTTGVGIFLCAASELTIRP